MKWHTANCFLFLLTLLLWPVNGQAQSLIIDSLKTVMEHSGHTNGERINAMSRLSIIRASQNQPEEAIKLVEEAQKLSYHEKDGRYGAVIQSSLSYIYVQQDSLRLAFQAMDSAEWYASNSENKIVVGRVRFRRGWLEYIIDNPGKAYKNMLEALQILEGEPGTQVYLSNIYHYLAAIQGYWKETEKQFHYTRLCLDEAMASGDPDAIANACLSMGTYYLYRYRETQSRHLLDSARYYYTRILKLSDAQRERITLPSTEAIAALNIANLYYEFYPLAYRDSTELYLQRALAAGRKTKNVEVIASSYGIQSEYALKEGNYNRAENLLQMALSEISNNTGGTLSKGRINNALARVAEKSGNIHKALKYYKAYMRYDQDFFNEEKLSITQRLEAQYQSEKKELALSAARQEATLTKKLNHYYLILMVAGLTTLFFLFRSYHFRLKASQQRQRILTGEKNEAKLQTELKIEETARLQAERELMQERLNRLEKELLAGTLQLEEKNILLQDLRKKIEALDSQDPLHRQINRLIFQSHEGDKGYDELKAEFSEIHPDFIAGLQHSAENKLTRLDLKYCSYILMGLTNKEIAIKLNIDPKSIRMARYRIKQKLNLSKDESLDHYIQGLGGKAHSNS